MLPFLFHYGRISLPTYGLLVAAGMIVGLIITGRLARRHGLDADKVWNLGILAVFSAIVGAKLLLIINDLRWYAEHPREIFSLATLQAGGVFYGGLVTAILVSLWYLRRNRMPVLTTCDVFAPGIALGHAIGRMGCFAAGCCWGRPSSLPWAVTFTNPLAAQLVGTPLGVPLHPTQIYEALLEISIFGVLLWVLRQKRSDGQVIGGYMFLYGFARFFLEFLRGDPDRGSVLGGLLSATQLISILLVIVGGVLWLRRRLPRYSSRARPVPQKDRIRQ